MPKSTKTNVARRLDHYERAICKLLANDTCIMCPKPGRPVQWAHIVPRERRMLRWTRANSMILCKEHHYEFDHLMIAPQQAELVNKLKPGSWPILGSLIRKKFELSLDDMVELLEQKKNEYAILKGEK